jgi:hypothetical protein
MAMMMIQNCFAPMSNGICGAGQILIMIFPHWYIGFIIPFIFGGLIPGVLVTTIPYGICICLSIKRELWGCQEAM